MSKQTLGKTLLRNVIRHTDAHNKIQEETEMWKMRGWEVEMSHPKHLSDGDSVRRRNHCHRLSDPPRDQSRASEHDDREAHYWTRKLYEFEAKDPDRWGHSGFKELYPEEFESDSDKSSAKKKAKHRKMKKSKSDTEEGFSKRSKKSSRKKKKKKKKHEGEKQRKAESSSSSDDDNSADKVKARRKKSKGRHKTNKYARARKRDEGSSSEDSNDEERRTRSHKKRKLDSRRDSDSGLSLKKRRTNWKAAGEESSHGTSGD
ncbi:uncharacterized protein NKAPD1 [Nelusetta ayraudi]|uniref:uncharacterized protein NKAPD1 n=1 Tax=Nelusetta ayraudi TaxID=303726 RepID=UPI003F7221DB